MTAPEVRRAARSWRFPILMGLLAVGIAVNFALLIPTLHRQSLQATEGQKARDTQCRTFPITLRLYAAAAHYHLITRRELAIYMAAGPRGCPRAR